MSTSITRRAAMRQRVRFSIRAMCIFWMAFAYPIQAQENWGLWLQQQIQSHPDVVAARANSDATLANADALEKPLFNPELETEFEKFEDADNYRVGISQQLDLWNQRGAQRKQAQSERIGAEFQYQLLYAEKLLQAISELVEYRAANESAVIAQQQEAQFESLSGLIQQRQQAGDIGSVDAALTNFSLSRQLQETASAQVRLRSSQARLQSLLPDLSAQQAAIPDALWQINVDNLVDTWIEQHPNVAAAKSRWESLRAAALVTQRENKATPTIGINTGKEEEEKVVGLTLSIPLQVRNNYSARGRSAEKIALAAESAYLSARREQVAVFNTSLAELEQYRHSYQRWQDLVSDQIERSSELLEQQWSTGDLSTSDYLLALQQRAEGLNAGIELRRSYHQALVNCLFNSGRLRQALDDL